MACNYLNFGQLEKINTHRQNERKEGNTRQGQKFMTFLLYNEMYKKKREIWKWKRNSV